MTCFHLCLEQDQEQNENTSETTQKQLLLTVLHYSRLDGLTLVELLLLKHHPLKYSKKSSCKYLQLIIPQRIKTSVTNHKDLSAPTKMNQTA